MIMESAENAAALQAYRGDPIARIRQLEAALRAVEWGGFAAWAPPEMRKCSACHEYAEQGHATDCLVGLALHPLQEGGIVKP
jgi:hypothetical protein